MICHIEDADLTRKQKGIALGLYCLASPSGDLSLPWDEAQVLCECNSRGPVRRHLVALKKAGILTYSQAGERVFVHMLIPHGSDLIAQGSAGDLLAIRSDRSGIADPSQIGSDRSGAGSDLSETDLSLSLYSLSLPDGSTVGGFGVDPHAAPAPIEPRPTGDLPQAKKRGRVSSDHFDPRKISPSGLIPAGKGSTPVEIHREFFNWESIRSDRLSPFNAQVFMDEIADLDRWRAVCAAWAGAGYQGQNRTGLTEWYTSGIPAYADPANKGDKHVAAPANQNRKPGRPGVAQSSGRRPAPPKRPAPTPEEAEALARIFGGVSVAAD